MAETTVEQPLDDTTDVELENADIESYTTESEAPVAEGEYTEALDGRFGDPQPPPPGPSQERHRPRPDRPGHRQVEDQRSHP